MAGMMGGGAFGGGKAASGAQDPLTFLRKPIVILRLAALIFAMVVFGAISSSGWTWDSAMGKDVCIMNKSSSACNFATFIGVVAFIGSVALLVGEWFFEKMSSIKTRKHFVIADMAFSGVWAVFYFLGVCVMIYQWSQSDGTVEYGAMNVYGAIFFALLSVFVWGGGAYFAYNRFKAGADTAFSQGIGDEAEQGMGPDGSYQQYPGDATDTQYAQQPFNGGQGGGSYQQVQY